MAHLLRFKDGGVHGCKICARCTERCGECLVCRHVYNPAVPPPIHFVPGKWWNVDDHSDDIVSYVFSVESERIDEGTRAVADEDDHSEEAVNQQVNQPTTAKEPSPDETYSENESLIFSDGYGDNDRQLGQQEKITEYEWLNFSDHEKELLKQ